jgi:hypothetical protein
MSIWSRFRNGSQCQVSDAQRASWERMYKRGGFFFVSVYGVLLFGGWVFLVTMAFSTFIFHQPLNQSTVLLKLFTSLFVGFVYGSMTWFLLARNYRRAKAQTTVNDSTSK